MKSTIIRSTIFSLSLTAVAVLGIASEAGAQRAAACDRSCLEGWVDRYLDAVIAADPSQVMLANDVRFTEDGQQLEIGDGLWNTMKSKGGYRLFVADEPAGQVAFLGTINEDHSDPAQATPALLALRLKIERGRIAEIEQMLVRDAAAAGRVAALGSPNILYLQTIQRDRRMSRDDLIATANKYFTGMQQNDGKGDYPFTADCNRIENGNLSTNQPTPFGQQRPDPATSNSYSGQWSCLEQFQSGLIHFVNRIRDRRFVAVDQERGLVFSFVFFDHSGGLSRNFEATDGRQVTAGPTQPWTWYIAELFKVEDQQIRQIEAILQRSPYGMNSGWSSYADGLSDVARDETGL
jgi:hypothetical protein